MSDVAKSEKINCIVRIINLAAGAVMIGFGVGGIIFMAVNQLLSGKFFLVFSPIFMILFGLMVIAAQCKIEFLTGRFGFLNSLIGRGIFNIYLASTVFYYFSCTGNLEWLGWVMAIIMFVMGIVYFILHFCGGGQQEVKESKEQMM